MTPKTIKEKQRRAEVLAAIQTPLAFYSVIALVAEVGFASAAVLKKKGVKSFVESSWFLLEPSLTYLALYEIQFAGLSTM